MALLFCDGWDMRAPNGDRGLWNYAYTSLASGLTYTATPARTGAGSVHFVGQSTAVSAYLRKVLERDHASLTVGVAVYLGADTFEGRWNHAIPFLCFRDKAGVVQAALALNDLTGNLELWRGRTYDGVRLASGPSSLARSTWHLVEIKIAFGLAGHAEVRLNGLPELVYDGATSTADGHARLVDIGVSPDDVSGYGARFECWMDDFVLLDAADQGEIWPGGAGVHLLTPDGAGTYNEWYTNAASAWEALDDLAGYGWPDGSTGTIYSDEVGKRTSVTLSNLPLAGEVLGVLFLTHSANAVAGLDVVSPFLRIHVADHDLVGHVPGTSYGWHNHLFTISPATGLPWLSSEVNALEIGYTVMG